MASAEGPSIGFPFKEEDVPKLVFQCCRPGNIAQEMRDSNSASQVFEIFEEALKQKSMEPLLEELHRKVDTINRCISSSPTTSSANENNASDLKTEELELLTFAEVLSDAGYTLPVSLERKRKEICANRRIPLSHKADPQGRVNKFFVYTLNKTLVQICKKLSAEEVFEITNFIIERNEEENTDEQMVAIRKTEQEMVKAISVIESVESLQQPPALKDAAFYYMILFMFKSKLLNSIHTEMLWKYLKGAASKLSGPRKHIEKAVEQLKIYQLGSSPPGLCLIFAMDMKGKEADVRDVKSYFENKLKYDVIYKENPTVNDVKSTIEKVSGSRYKFYDSLVVWFMAHGDEAYLLVDGGEIHRRRDLIQPLVTIEWLQAKPKLFFIHACAGECKEEQNKQGEKIQGVKSETELLMGIDYSTVCNFADTVVCHATTWYEPAILCETGSPFVKTILQVLGKKGGRVSLDNALRETCLRMNSVRFRSKNNDLTWRQTPYYESSLQKKFIFPAS